ncbi:hypothetical protein F9C07_10820 [Aspergillus flavus]|uniref:Uncharacterized protein n=1 Tax=Aspergillus flavus (strain ATCC 200026 / FGSC A1120 / IAM 13836 / NRRL 3357 / JCM 12722 / SRRC 167) TaxID=332952 RepID=A0A7U2MRW3_ASPFN|nr:hypothetical protein F9C07_10820 [Aspergillus flavus]
MYIPVDISGEESNNLDTTERKRMMPILSLLTIIGENILDRCKNIIHGEEASNDSWYAW